VGKKPPVQTVLPLKIVVGVFQELEVFVHRPQLASQHGTLLAQEMMP